MVQIFPNFQLIGQLLTSNLETFDLIFKLFRFNSLVIKQALKKRLAEEFSEQLTVGAPANEDETGLRHLAAQIKTKKVLLSCSSGTLYMQSYICFSGLIRSIPPQDILGAAISLFPVFHIMAN